MEDIEYLDEYKDLVMPGINKNVSRASAAATSAASALGSGQRRRRLSSDSTNSSSIDADIFQKLFHGKFTDDELPTKNNSKGRGRRSPLSPSSSDESNDALEALFNRKTNLGTQAHKRRERYESLDSIDDLSQALMRPTHRSSATKPKKAFPQKTSNSSTSNSNRGNVSAKSTSSLSTKSSTGQPAKSKRSSDVFRSGGPTNGNVGGRNKAVTIVKPIKSSLSPNKREPKTDPLNLKDYIDGSDSDSSYEYESDFYGDEEDDDISNPIIDLSTDTSRTNSVADTVTPVVSEDDDPADAAVQQEHQDPTTSTEPQPQQTSMCGDNELLQYYLNNLSKAETPPIYKKLSSGRKCRSSEKKSPSNSLEQVKHGAIESGGSVVDKEVATGPEENRDSIETACSTEKPKEKPYDLNDSLTLESVQRMSLDLAEQIMQIDNERTIEYERHSGSKGRSVRSRSNMSDDHPSTSNSKSSALAHRHVRKLTYSNDQLDKCVPLKANELRRTQSDSAFPKRDSRGRLNKKRQSSSVATDQSNSTEVATSSVPTETPIKRKRGRPRKMKPQGIEIKSSETKPENNTETELELTKENIQNPPDKEISIVKTDNEITTPETVSSLETPAQIENENKDSTLTEKTINAAENQLSAKDVRVDENATLEIHQSQNEIPTEDSKLISEIKNVPKDLKPVQDSTEALGALPEVSVKRRALRSDDRKSELSSHEVETTPLQAQANESRSSRRIPKSETPVPITEQMTSIRNRRRNDSLKLASEQSSASTTSDIERDKSPIGKQPRSTQKRNKDKFIRDNKELASSLSPFAERITRSTKREEAILELPQASDSIQQRGESTRSSERYSRRDPANRSRKELEAESTENSEIANQPESRTENQKSKEKSAIKKKTKKIVDSQPNADPELVEKKAGDKSGDMETKIQNTASDETEIVQDVEPNPKQQSGGDTEMNPIEKITETKIQKDENIKPMKDDEVIEPVQESTKSNLEQDNNVESDLVEQTTDDLEINPFEKIAQDKIEKEENIKPMQNEAIIEPVHESTKSNSEHDNIVKDKQNTEVETEQPEKSEGKISENSTIEKKRLRPKNKNVLDKVIGDSEIEPAEQKAKLKSGKKKGRQNDNESEILVQAESTQEIATEETCLDLDRESRFKKETSVSVEGPKQTQEEANFENRVEVCCKEKSTKTVSPDAVPQVGEEVAVLKADVNKKVELIQTSVDGEIELVTENTLESNEHEQIQNEEAESMQTEIESPPELNIEETPVENEVNSIDEEPDAVHGNDAKLDFELEQAAQIGTELTETNDIKKVDEIPCALESEPVEKTIFEESNSSVIVNESNDTKTEVDEQTMSSKELVAQSSIETNESASTKNLSLKTVRTTKLRSVKKRKALIARRKKKYRTKNIDEAVEVQETVPIVESLEFTEPLQPAKIEIQKSSTSTLSTDTTTSLSPTSGTCRKLRVLVKRTPTCLKGERRSLTTGKKSNRFAEKLDSIDESPVISSATEKPNESDKPDQALTEIKDKETPIINQESLEKNNTALDDIACNPSDEVALAPSASSIINESETTGVTHEEESSQLDVAAKQKKIEEQKKDLHPIVKNQGRRRKQVNEEEQPNKKRTRLDTEIKTVGKRHVTTIGQKKTLSSGGRGNIETSTESIKKPLIQTLLGPDVSLRKPENVNKSMDSKKINSDEQSYVTVLTKKPTVAATATSQETKSAHTSVGAAPRKVNISISVLPPKEVEVELPVASTITEKRNITASTMVSKKNKCIPNKTTPIAPPKKANLLNAAKIPDKNLLAQSEQSKKSEPRKSEVKTGLEATIAPATKPLAKAKQGSEAVAKTDKTVVEHPVKQLPEPQLQLELEVSANKSLEQQKKLPSRKSEGGKARRSAIKTDPLSNTIERKSLPLTRPSQESSSSSTTLKASEVESYESAESLDHSLSLVKRKSQDNKQSSDGSEKVLLETEVVSSSMDASKDQLVEKKSRKTVASVTTHMTRSSSCNRSLSATPIATPQRQRKVPNKVSGVPLVSGKVEAQELPATPRMNSRRSQKDLSTPYLELVNHGYTRKRKMPANAATDAKRAKQQPQPNEETKSTESWAEEMLAQEVRVEVDIPQQQVQQNEMQLEQTDQNRKHQSQNLQEEVVQPMETDVQLQEVQETAVQQNKDVDRQQEEHTNVAFPVMITAAIDKPPLAAATSASIVAHPNPSDTLVEEVRTIRRCRVRLNRKIVRNWINEQHQILQQQQKQEEQKKKKNVKTKSEKLQLIPQMNQDPPQVPPQVPPTRSIEDQLPALPTLHEIEQVHETLPPPEPTPAREEVKSEAEDIPVVEPVSQPMDISPDPTPAATLAPSHAPHQVIRINAPTRSASNQNNATSIGGSGAAAGQLPFGSTKMFSFLYPMRYQHSYGAVGLDFCCPNLDGPMRAIDPTRLHDKVELPVLELPQYMVISTKFISKQDKNIPNKVRAKMAEMAKDGKPLTGQTIQTGMLTPDPILSVTNDASAPVSVPPLAPIPVPSLLTAAPASIPEPEVSSIDALSRQLPRGTTLTKKVLPPGASMPLQAGSSNASQLGPRELIQLPPICPADKQRCELQTRVQLFDLVLQELSRRATLLTVAERQKTIEEIVKTSTLLPIDVDVGTKLLENYVYYLNRATNSNIPVPSYRINTVAPATTMPSPAMTNTQSPVSNSVLSKCTPRKLPASIPLYDSDRNIIGYQRLTESVTTKGLPVTCSTSIVPTQLTQDHRVLSTPADKTNARATAITHRKVVAKTMTPPAHWTSPEETGPTIRSIKNIGNGKMISFNPPSVQKPSTTFKPQTITKSPAIGNVSNPTRSKPITTPAPISVPAAPNITPNLFVVNQVSAQPEECILPDVTNTVPLETEIKGEVEDVVEIVP
ncbi:LOW QUALITY PROTEIN: titin [Drosophila willistoni]|uniref:LOW QUALITY PROTEIN: titin n=1 Tax=Drosophila willistoni TaxID=7260 RepID=UPI001F081950|nr:LOW QUALITY PROTEIN: titin [Drosophila willistoni]